MHARDPNVANRATIRGKSNPRIPVLPILSYECHTCSLTNLRRVTLTDDSSFVLRKKKKKKKEKKKSIVSVCRLLIATFDVLARLVVKITVRLCLSKCENHAKLCQRN